MQVEGLELALSHSLLRWKEVGEVHFNLSLRLPKAVVIQVVIVITVILGVSVPLAR
jgi:hypothetical protein